MNKQTKAEWLKKELGWFEKELGWFKKELESYEDPSMLHIDWKTLDELYEQVKEMQKL